MTNRPRTRSTTLSERTRDRLSELPLSIIHEILGRVDMRVAVSMRVLSRQWRHTWTTLPRLLLNSFDDDDELTTNYINNVLLHHKGPIHTFKLIYSCSSNFDSVEKWLLCLASNDVRELSIGLSTEDADNTGSLKSNLYKCVKLTVLKLWYFKMIPPPSTFKGFLFLKALLLAGVVLSPDGFESLVGHCPVLEILAIKNCSIEELRISSSSLKKLEIYGSNGVISLHAPILDGIILELPTWDRPHNIQNTVCNYTNFLINFTNLVELNGIGYFTEYLSYGLESCQPTLVFHHLKVISLEMSFASLKEIAVVARLLSDAPNLRKVELSAFIGEEDGAPDVCFREYFKFAPNFTHEKLKDVALLDVCHYPIGVQLVKFLLETSPVLETMVLQLEDSNVDKVLAEVLGFGNASPNVQITFIRD